MVRHFRTFSEQRRNWKKEEENVTKLTRRILWRILRKLQKFQQQQQQESRETDLICTFSPSLFKSSHSKSSSKSPGRNETWNRNLTQEFRFYHLFEFHILFLSSLSLREHITPGFRKQKEKETINLHSKRKTGKIQRKLWLELAILIATKRILSRSFLFFSVCLLLLLVNHKEQNHNRTRETNKNPESRVHKKQAAET